MKFRSFRIAVLLVFFAARLRAEAPPVSGAVVSGEADATAVGVATLAAGGNAVDAAVATALALAVVHPEAGNLGGGGFAVVRMGGEEAALDFREVAPAGATESMFLDAAGEPVADATLFGPRAAGVPGSPRGLHELHRRFGKLPWRDVVGPAIALARDGFAISARTARELANERDKLTRFPETAAVWLAGGRPLGAGSRLKLPDLAATLAGYADRGPEAIVTGPVAAAIEKASRAHGGLLTAADLAAYRPVWREPLRFERFGWTIVTMPLPSSGGVLLGEALGLLERAAWRSLPAGGVERAHLLAEVFRRVYADRFVLGDPASSRATPEELLDPAWLDARWAGISANRAAPSPSVRPFPGAAPGEGTETTHISVIDRDGNLVALTTTLNDLFGCRYWVPGAGFFLNDEMDDFATAPRRPNLWGLVQGESNAVAAGHRMLSSMTPAIALRGDPPNEAIVLGGRGGSRIPTAVIQALLNLWDGDAALAAVSRPRLHHQWLPDRLEVEAGALDAAARAELERRGHAVVPLANLVRVNVARRLSDGSLEAAGDPRGPEVAAAPAPRPPGPVLVRLQTALGEIDLEIDSERAPATAANFLAYVDAGRYDGGRFHRTVRPDTEVRKDVPIEVVQAGVAPEREKEDFAPIALERTNATGLRHRDGTISMARGEPDSATSDFFICIGDQPLLDFGGARNPDGQGFAAFGRVLRGMDVARRIQAAPAEGQALAPPVRILSAKRLR
jgi:gamma-glutamyltranspeptidase/glutathione hydrolase